LNAIWYQGSYDRFPIESLFSRLAGVNADDVAAVSHNAKPAYPKPFSDTLNNRDECLHIRSVSRPHLAAKRHHRRRDFIQYLKIPAPKMNKMRGRPNRRIKKSGIVSPK
jgi:hypothetical protein